MASRRWWATSATLLGLLTVVVFVPGLSDEFTWDDNGLIRTNEHVQRPEHFREALTTHFWNVSESAVEANETYDHLYRPLVTLAHIIQFQLFGVHAAGYRAISLGLHLLCCILGFFWLARRLPNGNETHRVIAVGLGAALFAFHPSRVEAVSWISGSAELWMCALILMAALAFDSRRSWLAGILLALALFAKESAVVAAPLLLADRFLVRGSRDRVASVALTTPVVAALAARISMVHVDFPSGEFRNAVPRTLASLGVYAQQIVSPWNPTAFPGMRTYSCETGESLETGWLIAGALVVLGIVGLGALALRRHSWRPWFADALWIIVPLLPVVNLIDIGSRNLTADRFLYVPMLGMAALAARGVLSILEKRPAIAKVSLAGAIVLLVSLAIVTSLHSRVFASSSSLWEYEVQRNPTNPFALHAVGTARTNAGLRQTGLEFLERAEILAEQACVQTDQVRAARDLGWALSTNTSPDDRDALMKLKATYSRVSLDGVFEYDGSPGWSVQLTPGATRDLVSHELAYALPRATIEARLGHVNEALAILGALGSSHAQLHPRSESLRLRLLAAQGHVRQSLIELAQDTSVADLESLITVLGTLHETLEEALVTAADDRASLASYALGFGPSTTVLRTLSPRDRAVLEALRAYNIDEPIDIDALRAQVNNSNELPRFIEHARARAEIRQLDTRLLEREDN